MLASWPAARSAFAFFQLLPGAANTAFTRRVLFGILDPADELIASQGCDVAPRIEHGVVGDECGA